MSFSGLILDFDGVMADTVGTHTQARLESFEHFGFSVDVSIHEEAHRHGSHPPEIIGWILKQAGLIATDANVLEDPTVQKVVALKNDIYREHAANGLTAVAGFPKFIDWAYDLYGTENLAIATTASRLHEVNPFMRRYGLMGHFKAIVGKEDTPIGRTKPDGFVYQEAVVRLGLNAASLAAIEDTPLGIQSAQAADLAVLGITTTHAAVDLRKATRIIRSFEEASAFLTV